MCIFCPVALYTDIAHLETPHIAQTCAEKMCLALWMYNSP